MIASVVGFGMLGGGLAAHPVLAAKGELFELVAYVAVVVVLGVVSWIKQKIEEAKHRREVEERRARGELPPAPPPSLEPGRGPRRPGLPFPPARGPAEGPRPPPRPSREAREDRERREPAPAPAPPPPPPEDPFARALRELLGGPVEPLEPDDEDEQAERAEREAREREERQAREREARRRARVPADDDLGAPLGSGSGSTPGVAAHPAATAASAYPVAGFALAGSGVARAGGGVARAGPGAGAGAGAGAGHRGAEHVERAPLVPAHAAARLDPLQQAVVMQAVLTRPVFPRLRRKR